MANSLGQLVVSLGLDAAEFVTGMTKSEAQAKKFAESLDRGLATAINSTAIAVTALVAATGVAAAAFQSLVNGAAKFKDLEESTGATAESLASLAVSGATAGVSMDSIGAAANKLTRTLVGVDDESKAAGAALAAIGISVKDFKNLDPVAQYEAVGKALGGFADGAGKVAIAQALFGKNGAEQLRVFKAIEEAGGRQVILTQRQIELADAYADAQAKSRAQLQLYAQAAATEALPAITDLTTAAGLFIKGLIGVNEETGRLATNNAIKDFAEDSIKALGFLVDAMDGVGRAFQFTGKTIAATAATTKSFLFDNPEVLIRNIKAIGQAYAQDVTTVLNKPLFSNALAQVRALRKETDAQRRAEDRGFTPTGAGGKPALKFNFDAEAAGKAAAEQRKLLDGQLRAIRDFAKDQQDAFDFANTLVKGSYDDARISLEQSFEAQHAIRDAALQAQVAALDRQIAAEEAFRRKASKPEDREDAANKIAALERERARAVRKASDEIVAATLEEKRVREGLVRQYQDFQAQVKQLSGDTQGAAQIRIAQQVEDARKLLHKLGQDEGQADTFGSLLTNTEALSKAQTDYNRLLEHARNEEESLLLAAQAGGRSELETMRSVGAARSETLQKLSLMVEKANELAKASDASPDAIRFAEQLGLAYRHAAAEVDPLLLKIRDVGREAGESIASGFEDAVTQGKGLRAMLKGVADDLSRILARNLITKPAGDYLSNLIGGNGQASGGGGLIGSLLGAAGAYFGGSGFSAYDAGGYGLTSGGSSLGSLGLGGGRAIGGPTMPNTSYPIAERHPEVYSDGSRSWLITGSQRGRVDPNPSMAGGRSVNVTNNFTVPGNVDRRTQTQIAALAARSVAAASARNN